MNKGEYMICRTSMIAPQGQALITVPVKLPIVDGLVEQGAMNKSIFCTRLLENRLLRVLRFQQGEVDLILRSFLCTSPNPVMWIEVMLLLFNTV